MKWTSKNTGKQMEAEDEISARGKELNRIYDGLTDCNLDKNQRQQVLKSLHKLMLEIIQSGINDRLTSTLLELSAREIEIIERGIGLNALKGLRNRLLSTFTQWIRSPAHNPGCLRNEKLNRSVTFSNDTSRLNQGRCSSCKSMKPLSHFIASSSNAVSGRCKACRKRSLSESRQLNPYQELLKQLRLDYGNDPHTTNLVFRINV
jgi:hypothetical protein